ncbi:MAG: endonuclease/exonuclease/phosphatase family protein [Thermodesulfobacteriota bacterium]
MIGRIQTFFRKLRRSFSRSEWAVRLLGMYCGPEVTTKPGLVLIQIDGFAYTQLERAMEKNRLPFLKSLQKKEGYTLKLFYSGIPSTTPAVQGELYFGIPAAVPAFDFIRKEQQERVVMFHPEAADQIGRELADQNPGLLKGGASYSNIYSGGAEEARYCVQEMGLNSIWKATHPLNLILLFLIHITKVFRIMTYGIIEFGVAIGDFFRGISHRGQLLKELKFIFTRVAVCAVLRELIRFRVKLDVSRGIRIIHANFVGYDEQSHRRGPSSAFAHWSLQGIDEAIQDIYRTALRADCRDYQLIVFSDHGQEGVVSYADEYGISVRRAVNEVFASRFSGDPEEDRKGRRHGRGRGFFSRRGLELADFLMSDSAEHVRTTSMGPLGHIYLPGELSESEKEGYGRRLVKEAHIPLVLYSGEGESTIAINSAGAHDLKQNPEAVLGSNHPFLEPAAEDLETVCRHPDAGDFVISGWRPGEKPLTFALENGAHGGPGSEETRGFVLLPGFLDQGEDYLRPVHLRKKILDYFQPLISDSSGLRKTAFSTEKRTGLRVMTYNIHSCICMDGKINPDRVGRVIRHLSPDLVALQEVDAHRARTGYTHQAAYLAEQLGMDYHYFPLIIAGREQYGIAVLSRFSITDIQTGFYPDPPGNGKRERRGAIRAMVEIGSRRVHFFNTHLDLSFRERQKQARCLTENGWLGAVPKGEPVILCGDLNASPRSPVYQRLVRHLADVQNGAGHPPSFFSWNPFIRLDHIFVSSHFKPRRIEIPRNQDTRLASDHLPVFADLKLDF